MTAPANPHLARLGDALRIPAMAQDSVDTALRLRVRTLLDVEQRAGAFRPACDAWLAGWDEAFTARLASHGLVGMTIPQEYGGAGSGMLARHVVLEELLAAGAPVAAHWVADRQIVPSLLKYGTPELKQRYLPDIAGGRCFMAVGMSEPDAGSDLTAIRTRAISVPGGWRLSGTKVWTSGAHHAHAICVFARTPELDGERPSYTQFFVEAGSTGLEIRPIVTLDGVHHFNEVVLQDVLVPDEFVLGEPGDGWNQIRSELSYERGGPERFLSLFPLLRALVEAARGWLADDGYVADQVGGLLARLAVLRRMSLGLADSVDRTGSASAAIAAMVKDLGTTFESDVVDVARRIVHDRWYDVAGDATLPELLAQATQRLPAFGIRAGSTEMLRGLVAREVGLR